MCCRGTKKKGSTVAVRDRLIVSAIGLMRRHGVAGTGISELIDQAGIARRSLYLNFPGGKSELLAEATAVAGHTITQTVTALSEHGPVRAVQTFIQGWREALAESEFTAGCPIVAAALGRTEAPEVAEASGQVFIEWERKLADELCAADVEPATAQDLATTTLAAVEGAIVMAIATQTVTPLDRVGRVLTELIAQHVDVR